MISKILMFLFQALLIIAAIGMVAYLGKVEDELGYFKGWKFNKKCLTALIPLGIFISTLCVVFIPSNTVGVKWSPFGGTKKNTLGEGIAIKSPVDKIYTIPTTVQERTIDNVTVQTKDAQFVSMSVNVKFKVDKSNAFTVYQRYTTIDNLKQNIIGNYSQKAIETVVTQYNVIDVLGEKKNDIYKQSSSILQEMLSSEGVELVSLTIKDMDAGEAIEKAIQDEAVAKKQVETAKQNQEKAKTEAETKLIEAEGEAKANAAKTEQLTDQILMEQWIKKWDGKLPTVSGTDGSMIDISSLLKK